MELKQGFKLGSFEVRPLTGEVSGADGTAHLEPKVMEVLANNPELSGKVGVESRDQVVNLSGYLLTSGQVMRAGRDASKVQGVRYVVNEIRPRLGTVAN